MNWLSKQVHKYTNHSNYDLTHQSYDAWLVVKDPTLPEDFDYFTDLLTRLYNETAAWVIAHPKRKTQYAESAGVRMEVHRWENGTLHARICLIVHYTHD